MHTHHPIKPAFVLVVEDDADLRKNIEHSLTLKGHFVMGVANVADAHELMKEKDFDLIVTDTNLPDGSGLQLLFEVQKLRKMKGIIINPSENPLNFPPKNLLDIDAHYIEPFTLNNFEKTFAEVIK